MSFTDLVAWGEALGLRTVGLLTQRDFLGRYGALDGDDRPSRSFVASPHGAGSHFLVLDQERA